MTQMRREKARKTAKKSYKCQRENEKLKTLEKEVHTYLQTTKI
jgi:hypothetical protein